MLYASNRKIYLIFRLYKKKNKALLADIFIKSLRAKARKDYYKPFIIKTPLIEGKTDNEENLFFIQEFIGDAKWEQLLENKLAKNKIRYVDS